MFPLLVLTALSVAQDAGAEACSEPRVARLDALVAEERYDEAWDAWEAAGPCPVVSGPTWLGLIGYALRAAPDEVEGTVRSAPTDRDPHLARAVATLLVEDGRADLAVRVLDPWPPVEIEDFVLDAVAHARAGAPDAEARLARAREAIRTLTRGERRAARAALRDARGWGS